MSSNQSYGKRSSSLSFKTKMKLLKIGIILSAIFLTTFITIHTIHQLEIKPLTFIKAEVKKQASRLLQTTAGSGSKGIKVDYESACGAFNYTNFTDYYTNTTSIDLTLIQSMISNFDLSKIGEIISFYLLGPAIFLVCFILSFLGWIGCCCCCCCPSFCCTTKTQEEANTVCKKATFYISIVIAMVLAVIMIVGLAHGVQYGGSITGFKCYILKIFYEIIYGEVRQTEGKWVGITGIIAKVDSIAAVINDIPNNAGAAKRDISWVPGVKEAFTTKLDTLCSTYASSTVDNGGGGNYISNFAPKDTAGTICFNINQEFTKRLDGTITAFEQINEGTASISTQTQLLSSTFDTAITPLNAITPVIVGLYDGFIVSFNQYVSK